MPAKMKGYAELMRPLEEIVVEFLEERRRGPILQSTIGEVRGVLNQRKARSGPVAGIVVERVARARPDLIERVVGLGNDGFIYLRGPEDAPA